MINIQDCNFSKKRLQRCCFLVNIAKFLRTPILKNICERLLQLILDLFLVTVCEGNRENLECLSNQTLVIKKAIYGRQSRLACASDCFDRNACTTEGWLANCAEEQETTSLIKNSCKASPCSLSIQTASDVEKIKGIFNILTINNINHTLPSNFVSVNKKYVEVEYLCVDKGKKMNLFLFNHCDNPVWYKHNYLRQIQFFNHFSASLTKWSNTLKQFAAADELFKCV